MSRDGRGNNAPQSRREWAVYRAGVREGIELAHRDAREKAAAFLLRFSCNGVELSTPSADAAEASTTKRRRSA
jgi:hypothetical protein